MTKVIWNFKGFVSLRCAIGLKNSRHFLNRSDLKLRQITDWSLAFSGPSGSLPVVTLSSYWTPLQPFFGHVRRCCVMIPNNDSDGAWAG